MPDYRKSAYSKKGLKERGEKPLETKYLPAEVWERVTGNEGELQLQRRGSAFELICNGIFLMATYNGAGEREMVRAVLSKWEGPKRPGQAKESGGNHAAPQAQPFIRLLLGGLGFGLSLQEALRSPLVSQVDLVELEEAVIRWNRGVLQEINGNALADPRVRVWQEDLIVFLQETAAAAAPATGGPYHGIVLDTDNGPEWLSRPANGFLYSTGGTALLHRLLLPGGALSVWSASPVPSYYSLLRRYFPLVRERTVLEETGLTSNYYLAFKGRRGVKRGRSRG